MMYGHGGNVALASRLYGLGPDAFLDFSANVNPFGPSELAIKAVVGDLDKISRYPDPACTKVRRALGEYLELEPRNILAGNGANELIHLVVRLLKPKTALIVEPTFSEYARAVKTEGGSIEWFPVHSGRGFLPDIHGITQRLPGMDMLFLCNPNNPSGSVLFRDELIGVLDSAGNMGTTVVIDEAFVDFLQEENKVTLRWEAPVRTNLLVLGSLTKFFALPGLRLGYVVGHESLIQRFCEIRDPWSVNCLAQAAAIASMKDKEYIRKTKEWIWTEMPFMSESLSKIPGVRVYPPSANYILTDLRGTGFTAARLQEQLGPKGILIRDCSNFLFLDEYYARFAIRARDENTTLLATLEDVLVSEASGNAGKRCLQ